MEAGNHSLKVIFGQVRRHLVPLYQRPYVWKQQEQWEPLWDDLRGMADRALAGQPAKAHFMGAIVLDQANAPYGAMDTRWVIDGQQRLTTLQIVLEAFGDACGNQGLTKYEQAAKLLTRNQDPLNTEEDHIFKIWPTNADQEHFRRVMLAGTPQELLAEYKLPNATWVGHQIADAYLFFFRNIDAWLSEHPGEKEQRASALFTSLKDEIRLVVIELRDGDDAQLIFETLNARGTALLPSDLIKNYLFIKAAEAKLDRERLYKKYWAAFDSDSGYWRQEVGRGRSQRPRLDLFIQHYLTLKTRDEVSVAQLYLGFKEYSQKCSQSVDQQLEDLARYSSIYRSFDSYPSKSPEGRFFTRLETMDVGTAYPFLLELFARLTPGSANTLACLRLLESFLVRRMLCQMNTRGYNRLFTELLSVFSNDHDEIPAALERALAIGTAESNAWPSDADISLALQQTPIYKVLIRARVNMLLEALNDALHDGKSEQLIAEDLTIEHLMPQSWTANWPLGSDAKDEAAIAERNRLIHTLGNLTLLTKKLNPSISNGAWEAKRAEILKFSRLNLNRELPLQWSDEEIKERTAALAGVACEIWDAPAAIRVASARTSLAKETLTTSSKQEAVVYVDDDSSTTSSNRPQVFLKFWNSLLERARGKAPLLANRSATSDNWISAPSGRSGFWYSMSLTQEIARVECYIRVKNGQDVHNKAILQELLKNRSAIEATFGGPLEWQELPGRIGCRICKVIPGSWLMPEDQWPPLQDQMTDVLVRMDKALRGPIHEIDVESVLSAELN